MIMPSLREGHIQWSVVAIGQRPEVLYRRWMDSRERVAAARGPYGVVGVDVLGAVATPLDGISALLLQ